MASLSAVTNQTDTQDTALQATYAGAKRRIATLEQELQTLHESGSKRKLYVIHFYGSSWFTQLSLK
jgi:hypothetical protein